MSWTPNSDDVVYQDSFWGLVHAHQGTFIESGLTVSVTGNDNIVTIADGYYYINGTRYVKDTDGSVTGSTSIDLASHVPSTTDYGRFVIIRIDTNGNFTNVLGTAVDVGTNDDSLRVPDLSASNAHCLLIRVRLENGTNISSTEIIDSCRIVRNQATIFSNQLTTNNQTVTPNFDRIRLLETDSTTLSSTTHAFQIGDTNHVNLRLDYESITAIDGGSVGDLFINRFGGEVAFGTTTYRMTYDGSNGNLDLKGGLTLTSNDAGSSANPTLTLFRNTASPANDDVSAQIKFRGNRYENLVSGNIDSENLATLSATTEISGNTFFGYFKGELVINTYSESWSVGNRSIGTKDVARFSTTGLEMFDDIDMNSNDITDVGTISSGAITSSSTIEGQFVSNATVDFNHPIDLDSNSASDFFGSRSGTTGYILRIANGVISGNYIDAQILKLQFSNDSTVGGNVGEDKWYIDFHDSQGTVGNISGEVVYTTFTGAHIGIYSSSTPLENLRRGVIVKSTGNVPSNATFSMALVDIDISNSPKDKTVMGVYEKKAKQKHEEHELINHHLDEDSKFCYEDSEGNIVECQKQHHSGFGYDKELVYYNAIGEGMILVTNADGDIQNGDYITTGTYNGIGVLQDDDILHSYTVAKCTEQVDWDSVEVDEEFGVKVKLVACTYHCG